MRRSVIVPLLVSVFCTACVTTELADMKPGQRPDLQSDEAGLWLMMDRAESNLRTSGRVVEDKELNAYVRGIVCRIVGEFCKDIRIYVVRAPRFNASMAPNGTMHIWTGMLLRSQNEAQFAFVVGHEFGHYLKRHSLRRWQAVRDTSGFLIFFQFAAAAAGYAAVGDLVQLAALGGLLAFSRDQEREADTVGLKIMSEAGYDPREAAKIWLELMKEKAAGDTESHPSIFFSTHPSSEERSETLARRAKEMPAATVGTKLGRERFKAMTLAYRKHWLRDEIRRKEFSRFEVVLAGLRRAGDRLGEIDFFQGETHRLRNDEGDPEKAMIAYKKALRDDGSPVETHRSLGLVQWSLGLKADARSSFSRYLLIKPDADDRRMIESYIEQLAVTRH